MEEVEKFLYGYYVEDDEVMFRFKYFGFLLRWFLLFLGWCKEWYVGICIGDIFCVFIFVILI